MKVNPYASTYSAYSNNLSSIKKAVENIATGKKVNSAADNAAAMAIIAGMYGQVGGLDQATENIQDSVSLLNTAEGAMGDSTDIIQRMRELGVQSANGTLTAEDRSYLQGEMDQLSSQLDAIAGNTQFNGIKTNDGSLTAFTTQVGANAGDSVVTSIGNTAAATLGINTDISTPAAAENSLATIDQALQNISSARSSVGATVNGLTHTRETAMVAAENLTAAQSVLEDSDIAKAASLLQQSNIKLYADMMAMSKAKEQEKGVLSILA